MNDLAPIVLFVYNRPWHTQQTVEALQKNDLASDSELIIYADGAKQDNDAKVYEVRNYIKTISGFKSITIIERDKNWGLADNIIDGVTEIINKYGKIIVLEDDIVSSVGFLKYMNDALEMYQNDEDVGCIHAWNYSLKTKYNESTFFLKGADCWGWATWKRGWFNFNSDGIELLNKIKDNGLIYNFNRRNTHTFFDMLKGQIAGKNNSWAIRWHASLFLSNKYCLQPTKSIVKNIGLDNSGEHCGESGFKQFPLEYIKLKKIEITEADWFFEAYTSQIMNEKKRINYKYYIKLFIPPVIYKIKNKIIKKQVVEVKQKHGWFGNYSSWQEAKKECSGYDSDIILQKVKSSLLKVKSGEAVYERDSVIFDKKEYSEELLIGLLNAAKENDYKLHVLDFGGSLGSTYYQNKDLLKHLKEFSWNIVEQEDFVKEGKNTFENDKLQFYYSIDECIKEKNINVLLLSNTLQYIEKPYELLNTILNYNFEYLIFETTAFIEGEVDIITKQIVPEGIYKASYPAWFFNEAKIINFITNEYIQINNFNSYHTSPIELNEKKAYWKGFIFKKKNK